MDDAGHSERVHKISQQSGFVVLFNCPSWVLKFSCKFSSNAKYHHNQKELFRNEFVPGGIFLASVFGVLYI